MANGVEIVSGFTDTAIRAAISAVQAATSNGGIVLLPPGTYAISATIVIPAKITLQGSGWSNTKLLAQSDITVLDIVGTATGGSNHVGGICLRDLKVDGGSNPAWSTKPMVRMMYADTCEFHKCVFINKYGIGFGMLAECWDNSFWQCRWDSCGGVNQGLPSMLVQSGDGSASGFGYSSDATNDTRFFNCTWESFRDGALWTKTPANANKSGTYFFYGCKADNVGTGLGTFFSFDGVNGVQIDHMNTSYVNKGSAYAGTPWPLFYFRWCLDVDVNRIQHNHGGTGEVTALLEFDGTVGSSNPNRFVRVAGVTAGTNAFSQFTQSLIHFTGSGNDYFDLEDNFFSAMNPTAVATIYSGTVPKQYPRPIRSKAGVFSDADFGTQEPGLQGNVACIIGYDETNNKLTVRTSAGVYKTSAAFT